MSLALTVRATPRAVTADRGVAIWLFGICFMLWIMVALGGATRLTGSGLSIMEWDPLIGALPPLSHAEWERLFALYQQIPQYDLVNHGMDLAGFKSIFWLEWMHRLWGRLLGIGFAGPLIWFALRGRIGRSLAIRLVGLLVLGGMQGGVGWFMVASGFDAGSTSVSAYRLVMHLVLALALYAAILWTALEVWAPRPAPARSGLHGLLGLVCCAVGVTIVAGGFVAGLKAGFLDNSFPLMGGRLVPEHYASLHPFVRNWFENLEAVQFDHRLLATLTVLLALATVVYGWGRSSGTGRWSLAALGAAVGLQYALGVTTLLLVVPVWAGTLHQAVAVLLLSAALWALFLQRRTA